MCIHSTMCNTSSCDCPLPISLTSSMTARSGTTTSTSGWTLGACFRPVRYSKTASKKRWSSRKKTGAFSPDQGIYSVCGPVSPVEDRRDVMLPLCHSRAVLPVTLKPSVHLPRKTRMPCRIGMSPRSRYPPFEG